MFSFLNCLSAFDPLLMQHLEERLRAAKNLKAPTTLRLDQQDAQIVYLFGWKSGTGLIRHGFHSACLRDPRGMADLDRAIDFFLSHWP